MKKRLFHNLSVFLLSAAMLAGPNIHAHASAVIKKPVKSSPNAAVYYTGSTTYYSIDRQKWKTLPSSLLYKYKAKKDSRYYRPLYYLTSSWLSNNKMNLTVHLTKSRSKSVSKIVQSTLGVSRPNTSLATSVSSSYSSTVSSSYTTDYTFVMKNYSKAYYYRPAFFGYIYKYAIAKTNRLKKRTGIVYSYTFDNDSGLYLKLAYK